MSFQSALKGHRGIVLAFLLIAFLVCLFISCSAEHLSSDKQQIRALAAVIYAVIGMFSAFLMMQIKKDEIESAKSKAELLSALAMLGIDKSTPPETALSQLSTKAAWHIERVQKAEALIFDSAADLVCLLDSELRICEVNQNAAAILGIPFPNLPGSNLLDFVMETEKEGFTTFLETAQKEKSAIEAEFRLKKRQVGPIDLHWTAEWSATAGKYYCVAEDISQRKQLERLRAEVTEMVSHDLRSPIAGLSYFLNSIASGAFGEITENGRQAASVSQNNIDQMMRIINQLLDSDCLESGTIKVNLSDAPVEAIIESAVQLLQSLSDAHEVSIEVSGNEANFLALADYDRSVQIIANILSNAIKWSPAKGVVKVRQIKDGKFVRVEIEDQGPGISEEFREKLFGRFQMGETQANSELPSSGLGLYLARKLAELQSAELGVTSQPGKGSCFWYRMRLFESD